MQLHVARTANQCMQAGSAAAQAGHLAVAAPTSVRDLRGGGREGLYRSAQGLLRPAGRGKCGAGAGAGGTFYDMPEVR